MRRIVLDMQSGLYAKAIQRILMQELDSYQIIISESPDKTVRRCKTYSPYALIDAFLFGSTTESYLAAMQDKSVVEIRRFISMTGMSSICGESPLSEQRPGTCRTVLR